MVRNLAARNRDAALSAAERTMYERARINLVSRDRPGAEGERGRGREFLDDALARGVLKPPKEAVGAQEEGVTGARTPAP